MAEVRSRESLIREVQERLDLIASLDRLGVELIRAGLDDDANMALTEMVEAHLSLSSLLGRLHR